MAGRMPPRSFSPRAILDVVGDSRRPMHAREIARALRVPERLYGDFVGALDDLAFEGALTRRGGQRFARGKEIEKATPDPRTEREGTLTVHQRGFGFVASPGFVGDDVFIGNDEMSGAMHGDRVKILVRSRGSRGPEGSIVEILERFMRRVPGTLRRRGSSTWLEPDDARIRGPIVLPEGIDARDREGNNGADGDAAVVTITRYPEYPGEAPEGALEAVLGRPGALSVEVAKVLVREQVQEVHTEDAVSEARAFGDEVPRRMLQDRQDLTHLPLPTIDPADARDHDDAVWVERDGTGYRATIAIADVSSYVEPDTALDTEAKARGCSIYLPDRAIPMLPRALSSNLCSLLPDTIRLCLAVEVELDATGAVMSTKLIRGFMNSRAKLSYQDVAAALGLTQAHTPSEHAVTLAPGLAVAYELSRILRASRLRRGAVDFELPEAEIVLDDEGHVTAVRKRGHDPGVKLAYQLIEELMLLANECVARWMTGRDIPTVYRVHPRPDEMKLERFFAMCEALGVPTDREAAGAPRQLAKLARKLSRHPSARVLHLLLLRSMKQAAYDVVNIGHFGLASEAYLHFTSPIRRYPDLVIHRAIHRVLTTGHAARSQQDRLRLEEAALTASKAERRAMDIEREIGDLYRVIFMRDHIGETYDGMVSSITGGGVFVTLDNPFVDVMVRFEDLGSEPYNVDEDGLRATAARSGDTVSIGDAMTIVVSDYSLPRRLVYGRRLGVLRHTEVDAQRGDLSDRGGPRRSGRPGVGPRRAARPGERRNERQGSRSEGRNGRPSGGRNEGRAAQPRRGDDTRETSGRKAKGKKGGRFGKTSGGGRKRR